MGVKLSPLIELMSSAKAEVTQSKSLQDRKTTQSPARDLDYRITIDKFRHNCEIFCFLPVRGQYKFKTISVGFNLKKSDNCQDRDRYGEAYIIS